MSHFLAKGKNVRSRKRCSSPVQRIQRTKPIVLLPQASGTFLSGENGTPRCTRPNASVTVEAAVVLPVLACLFVFLLFFFRVMQIQLCVQGALEETGRKMSVYAHTVESGADEDDEEDSFRAQYLILAKGLFLARAKEDTGVWQFVTGGAAGVSFWESEFDGDDIFLRVSYQVKFPISMFGRKAFLLSQQSCFRKWTGWSGETETNGGTWVYVAENGTVYHRTSSCTYLDLSIRSVSLTEVGALRNGSAQKYKKCSACGGEANSFGNVYVTNYGDCYHTALGCSKIKRTVEMVRLSEVGGRRECSKCWK